MVKVFDSLRVVDGLTVGGAVAPKQVIDSAGRWIGAFVNDVPHVAAKAVAELAISGTVNDGELIMIEDFILEFDADDSVSEGNIAIDISAGTKTQASGAVEITAGVLNGESIGIGDDLYIIDVTGGGVAEGAIQVDVSGDYASAEGVLTFTGVVADGEVVEINGVNFEFDTDGDITAGNVRVWVGANTDAASAIIALASIIRGNTACGVNAVDGAGDTLEVTARVSGVAGNAITVSTTCANANWGGITALAGGAEATAAAIVTAIVTASAAGTEAVTLTAGEGDQLGTLLIEATAAGAADGSAGNNVELVVSGTHLDASGTTLEGGSDATADEAIAAIVALGVDGFTLEAGDGVIDFEYDTAGSAGNDIIIDSDMENGGWDDTVFHDGDDAGDYSAYQGNMLFVADGYLYLGVKDSETGEVSWSVFEGTAL